MDASVIDRLAIYRNLITLRDGTRVLLRVLDKDDRDRLQAMFALVGDDDAEAMRENVKDPAVIQTWIDETRLWATQRCALARDRIVIRLKFASFCRNLIVSEASARLCSSR
jgi:hypothetical protein